MAEQEKIHQGWLYTRDGEKFAPITLIDDVFAMNGKKYKDVVNGDINSLKSTLNTALSSLNTTNSTQDTQIKALQNEDKAIRQEIVDKFANLNTDDNDKLFVIDKNDNVMAYIDGSGVHSLDFLVGENGISIAKFIEDDYKSFVTSTTGTLSDLTKKLANFGDDESDKFFIVDQYNNVIAYFDSEGTKSINFTTPEGNLNQVIADLDEEIGAREDLAKDVGANGVAIAQIKKDIQYFNATDEDTKLFVIDKNNNVIAYFDESGLHALNLISKNYNIETDLPTIEKNIQDIHDVTVPALRQEWQTADIAVKKYIDDKLQYFNSGADDTKLFIIDKNNNVIAYFDETGIHALNLFTETYDVENEIVALYAKIAAEAKIASDARTNLKKVLDTEDIAIRKDFAEADTAVTEAYKKAIKDEADARAQADNGLAKNLSDAKQELQGNIDKEIEAHIQDIHDVTVPALRQEWQTADIAVKKYIDDKLQYFNSGADDTKLFIIDKNNNVIAYFDETGIHALNLFTETYDVENEIVALYAKIAAEAKIASDARTNLKKVLDTEDIAIRKDFAEADTAVTEAYKKAIKDEADARAQADNGLAKNLSDAKQELQGNIDKEIEARQQGDQSNAAAIATNQANISGNASQIANIKKDLENFDLTASDAMYIIDKNTNVLAKFDSVGLTVTNVVLGKVGGRNMQTNGIFYGTSEAKTYNF